MQTLLGPSSMTEREFGMVFAKLALQLRWVDADEIAIRSYYEPLKDCTLDSIKTSAALFAIEPGRKFFPGSAEWHTKAQECAVEHLRRVVTPAHDEERGTFICRDCWDTGWTCNRDGTAWTCPGDRTCGRKEAHAGHTYTQACSCRPSNANFQRTKHFGAGR